jgi:CPA2 family monovalent cation:H+ antiporter-2
VRRFVSAPRTRDSFLYAPCPIWPERSRVVHETDLIATISVALGLSFVCGLIATRLRLPALVGYLFAGVLIGPFTPGFVADGELAPQLAEIGVILLMFGVGIHFSLRDLLEQRRLALPGAIVQSAAATALAVLAARFWGWDLVSGLVLGLSISVASTVVLLRALEDASLLDSVQGRIAVAWLIVEDLFTVLALVFMPLLAPETATSRNELLLTLGLTFAKVGLLVAATLFVGSRVIPWLLIHVSHTGSRELFTLAVLAVAFGVAFGAASLFGVSMALGAFLGGMVIGESHLSHRAAEEALPMRDAFAVLFFTSVGMLFDPQIVLSHPGELVVIVLIIIVGKPLAAFILVSLLGNPARTGLVVAAGLAQIGEFSFILAELGYGLGLLSEEARSLILASAIVSITLNPLLFGLIDPVDTWLRRRRTPELPAPIDVIHPDVTGDGIPDDLRDHVVLCGYGRVGRMIGAVLDQQDVPYVVVEQDRGAVDRLRRMGVMALHGDAAEHGLQGRLSLDTARLLVMAIPDPIATRQLAETARAANPELMIVARVESEDEWVYLNSGLVDDAVFGDHELARTMARLTVERLAAGPRFHPDSEADARGTVA